LLQYLKFVWRLFLRPVLQKKTGSLAIVLFFYMLAHIVGYWSGVGLGALAGNEGIIFENVNKHLSLRGRALPDRGNLIAVTDALCRQWSAGRI